MYHQSICEKDSACLLLCKGPNFMSRGEEPEGPGELREQGHDAVDRRGWASSVTTRPMSSESSELHAMSDVRGQSKRQEILLVFGKDFEQPSEAQPTDYLTCPPESPPSPPSTAVDFLIRVCSPAAQLHFRNFRRRCQIQFGNFDGGRIRRCDRGIYGTDTAQNQVELQLKF
ncbi:hypothetical protein B0H19DRAFT_1076241 [Mycena capillaripes]|nr:hypothetical protein B0H19DRAFT_1076241 [Mycena capillaripes]